MWYKHFKDVWESVESDLCSGRPATSRTPENVEHVQAAINKDRWLTVLELEADLGIPKTTVPQILIQDLGMKCVTTKFVPWLLLPEQKEHCTAVANDLIEMNQISSRNGYGCGLWSRNKGQVIPVEVDWLSIPKEGATKSQQDQDHVNCVFWLGTWCSPWVCSCRPNN